MLNFHELETKFGEAIAYHWLSEIEKVTNIPSWQMTELDPQTRLDNACRIQDTLERVAA